MNDMDELFALNAALHGLLGVDDKYTFYYDETNNIRKFQVDASGFNIAEPKVFVLGGIAHKGDLAPIDIGALRAALSIQKTAPEIKFKHIASGDFLDALSSKKLTIFLQWILTNQFAIHYSALDPLYWSIVDIVDSILNGLERDELYECHTHLKADLLAVFRSDLQQTTDLFFRYGYPNITDENRRKFLEELIELIESHREVIPSFNAYMLKGVVQAARKLTSLEFIEDNVPHLLISSFAGFYSFRTLTFKNSAHILDTEEKIKEMFLQDPPSRNENSTINYRFADSMTEPGIQVSDIVVGLLGKMFSYFVDTSEDEITHDRDTLSGDSLINACLLRDLVDASENLSQSFLHYTISARDHAKLDRFLRFSDGDYV